MELRTDGLAARVQQHVVDCVQGATAVHKPFSHVYLENVLPEDVYQSLLTHLPPPELYRETEGFEIPPHPDTRRKVVTMHLYWPADHSQIDLGTALFRHRLFAWPLSSWQRRFQKVKQFPFQPNSGYAFVVNNTLTKKS